MGLSKEELIAIASSAGKPETMKVSRRDLPYIFGLVSHFHMYRARALFTVPDHGSLSPIAANFLTNANMISRVSLAGN